MNAVPRAALVLGLAGLLPFIWGMLSALMPFLARPVAELLGARFVGVPLLVGYGVVILCFMSGALWGFAARSSSQLAYGLSILPALWAFLAVSGTGKDALRALLVGFVAILLLDAFFWLRRYAPSWWIGLRLALSAVVVLCLVIGLYYG